MPSAKMNPKVFELALGLLCCNFCSLHSNRCLHSHKCIAKAKWNEIAKKAKKEQKCMQKGKNQKQKKKKEKKKKGIALLQSGN